MSGSKISKGYFFSFGATLAGALVYIFSKAALKEVSLPQFGVYWFSIAICWNSILTARRSERQQILRLKKGI